MEDKVFLDEAGLGAVGKVIKKNYASKEDLYKIDVTEQLVDYVKKTDIPTKLSQLEEDATHRAVTDEEKEKWNNTQSTEVVDNLTTGGVDKALSAEQGKVLNNTKADKEEIDILAKSLQLLQWYNDVDHQCPQTVNPTFNVLTGSYILQPYRGIESLPELYRSYNSVNAEPLIGIMLVYRTPYWDNSLGSKVQIMQKIFDLNNQIVLWRATLDQKEEYSDKWICQHYTGDNFLKFCQQIRWTDWAIHEEDSQPFRIASSTQKGLMTADDKKKLDSINIEEIKSLIQRVEALESKIH